MDKEMSKLIPYLGGKRLLAKTIIPLFPKHEMYCEPFSGSATILLEKEPSTREVLNDINSDIVTLFRVVRNHLKEFISKVEWLLHSREEFDRLKAMDPSLLTDIQRSVRVYYLLKAGYAGKISNPYLGVSRKASGGKDKPLSIYRIEESLYEIRRRLEAVTIENLPYQECIARYDSNETLFYLDPPYFHHESDYGKGIFNKDDFQRLKDLLKAIKGKFVMSINDVPEVRKIFSDFRSLQKKINYSAGSHHGSGKEASELIIMSF
jgi:DNA adenine methylase